MDNATVYTAANQKLEPTLRAAMDATPGELAESENLSTGFTPETGLWEVIVLYSGSGDALLTAFPDFSITLLLGNYAIVRLPEAQLNAFAAAEQIIYVEKPKRLFFEILSGKRASCITPLQTGSLSPSPPAFPTPNLTGQGILVAVIDSGIDYTHPDFRTTDGNTRDDSATTCIAPRSATSTNASSDAGSSNYSDVTDYASATSSSATHGWRRKSLTTDSRSNTRSNARSNGKTFRGSARRRRSCQTRRRYN